MPCLCASHYLYSDVRLRLCLLHASNYLWIDEASGLFQNWQNSFFFYHYFFYLLISETDHLLLFFSFCIMMIIIFFLIFTWKVHIKRSPNTLCICENSSFCRCFRTLFVSALHWGAGAPLGKKKKTPDVTTVDQTCCAALVEQSGRGKKGVNATGCCTQQSKQPCMCVTSCIVFCASASKHSPAAAPAPINYKFTVHASWFAFSHSSAVEQGRSVLFPLHWYVSTLPTTGLAWTLQVSTLQIQRQGKIFLYLPLSLASFSLHPSGHCPPVEKPEELTEAQTDRQTDRRSLPLCLFSATAHTQIRERLAHAGTKPHVRLCVQRKTENKGVHANALLCVHVGHQRKQKRPLSNEKKTRRNVREENGHFREELPLTHVAQTARPDWRRSRPSSEWAGRGVRLEQLLQSDPHDSTRTDRTQRRQSVCASDR